MWNTFKKSKSSFKFFRLDIVAFIFRCAPRVQEEDTEKKIDRRYTRCSPLYILDSQLFHHKYFYSVYQLTVFCK